MKLIYSSRALAQLVSIQQYLTARSPKAAENVTASIRQTIARLKCLPHLGKPTDENDVHVLIEPEFHYRVFYLLDDDRVVVIRILHRSQV